MAIVHMLALCGTTRRQLHLSNQIRLHELKTLLVTYILEFALGTTTRC